ncbi:hypothetical protein ACUN9Y_16530 [Halomonas sp. V046]|uniref:hypothetical protein n=1 Tax=Halomonas sp. V046 TaxID=3459611 RepID=UPI004044B9DB
MTTSPYVNGLPTQQAFLCEGRDDASSNNQSREHELRREFGELLGLEGPVAADVLRAALASDSYARSLLASRRTPQMLDTLLASPPQQAIRRATFGPLELLQRGGQALLAWSRTGFATTAPAERQDRTEACLACPHRQAPRGASAASSRGELGVCGLCGCPLARKIVMQSESCPSPLTGDAGHNRWGQVVTGPVPPRDPPLGNAGGN